MTSQKDEDAKDKELENRMKEIRRKKIEVKSTEPAHPVINELMSWIRPVVDKFVAGDDALNIQSSKQDQMFVSYAYVSICQIRVTAVADHVRIDVRGEPYGTFLRSVLFSLPAEKDKTKDWVEKSLLDWYESLF